MKVCELIAELEEIENKDADVNVLVTLNCRTEIRREFLDCGDTVIMLNECIEVNC